MSNTITMEQTNKLVPELRFPEFVNDGEWEYDKFENLILTITPPKKLNSSEYKKEGKFPIIDQSQSFYCGKTNEEDAIIYNKNPLIIFGDHTCIVKIVNEPFAQGADGIKILEAKENINPIFLAQYLYFSPVNQEEYKRHFSILKNKIVYFPNHKTQEQQKIADCLTYLDEVITAHTDKLETLKNHKKGLMQNLFPQEGQKVPNYRFPEFVNDGEWDEISIGDKTQVTAGGTPESTNKEYWNGDIPWMNSGELNNKRIFSVSNFITERGLKESSTKIIPAYCILIGLAGQGKTRGTAAINYIELCTNQSIAAIHPNNKIFNSEFLYQKFDSMYEQLRFLSAGDGGRGGLNLQIIKSIKILIPSIEEQKKIAECLTEIDNLITTQTKKIEQLKTHKKGLMQGLFPKVKN